MKTRYILSLTTFFFFGNLWVYGQMGMGPAGGIAGNGQGSISYTIGQINYSNHSGDNGNISEGIQQPFEIYILTGVKEEYISLNVEIFPNPASSLINLFIRDEKWQKLFYTIYDLSGKKISGAQLTSHHTIIPVASYTAGAYIIKIQDSENTIKSYKIIKN